METLLFICPRLYEHAGVYDLISCAFSQQIPLPPRIEFEMTRRSLKPLYNPAVFSGRNEGPLLTQHTSCDVMYRVLALFTLNPSNILGISIACIYMKY